MMKLLLSLSKNTANSFVDLLQMPAHIVYGMYNTLVKMDKEEQERSDKESKSQMDKYGIPSINNLQNQVNGVRSGNNIKAPNIPNVNIPSMGSFRL